MILILSQQTPEERLEGIVHQYMEINTYARPPVYYPVSEVLQGQSVEFPHGTEGVFIPLDQLRYMRVIKNGR